MQFTFDEIWQSMGVLARGVAFILVIMSIYSVYVMVERFITFTKARSGSLRFVSDLGRHLQAQDVGAAFTRAKAAPQPPIARVVAAALDEYNRGLEALKLTGDRELGGFDIVDLVNRSIERVKEREIADLRRGLGGLASIASAAPFVGLFGTVVGIINAFTSMASSGQGGLASVSGGIAEALVVTAFGLAVAIPAVLLYNYFTGRVEEFVVDMNDVSSELINFMLREGRKQ